MLLYFVKMKKEIDGIPVTLKTKIRVKTAVVT